MHRITFAAETDAADTHTAWRWASQYLRLLSGGEGNNGCSRCCWLWGVIHTCNCVSADLFLLLTNHFYYLILMVVSVFYCRSYKEDLCTCSKVIFLVISAYFHWTLWMCCTYVNISEFIFICIKMHHCCSNKWFICNPVSCNLTNSATKYRQNKTCYKRADSMGWDRSRYTPPNLPQTAYQNGVHKVCGKVLTVDN